MKAKFYYNQFELDKIQRLALRENIIEILGKDVYEINADTYKYVVEYNKKELELLLYYIDQPRNAEYKCLYDKHKRGFDNIFNRGK
ncbi:MAG: hypothetical protein ACOCV1_06690 [Bacillota bacterium]